MWRLDCEPLHSVFPPKALLNAGSLFMCVKNATTNIQSVEIRAYEAVMVPAIVSSLICLTTVVTYSRKNLVGQQGTVKICLSYPKFELTGVICIEKTMKVTNSESVLPMIKTEIRIIALTILKFKPWISTEYAVFIFNLNECNR